MIFAYIQHGPWGGPYRTQMADGIGIAKRARPNPYPSGYGRKIPTQYRILYKGYWRWVYAACFSNQSSLYVRIRGVDTIVDLIQ